MPINSNPLHPPPLEYESPSPPPPRPWTQIDWYHLAVRIFIVYSLLSSLTLPFVDSIWLGKVPLLALIQLPKTSFAQWLITHAAMPIIRWLGLSRGSFSPDHILARPYALAAAYLIPIAFFVLLMAFRTRLRHRLWLWTLLLILVAFIDFCFTLKFARTAGLTIY
jgi:hypothetical protein